MKQRILDAMRADAIPAGEHRLWHVLKDTWAQEKPGLQDGKLVMVPPGSYTFLIRWTTKTMQLPHGETVMHDCPHELETHLNFALRAQGHVLVTGLGLGCIARGLLANPRVRHVTVIEISSSVLRLVHPYMPTKRITVIRSDALKWVKRNRHKFDCAYHDLWSDEGEGEPHLQVLHSHMISDCARRGIDVQGAWAHPRWSKRLYNRSKRLTLV